MVFVGSNWRPTGSYGMGAAAADFDNDGWPDIYVACDTAPSLLYRNNHDGTFREIGVPAGCAFDADGAALAGMGVGVGDYDADGWLDIVRTNFSEQVTTLYRNYGGALRGRQPPGRPGREPEVPRLRRRLLRLRQRRLGRHLHRERPRVRPDREAGTSTSSTASRSCSTATSATDVSRTSPRRRAPAIIAENLGRGCAFGDFDNDGDVDVIVNNLDGPPTLLRNDGGSGHHSILVKCVGTKSNRSAIGARVRVTRGDRSQIDEVMSGSSYYSQSDLRLHFGLGTAAAADAVEVAWPSGLKETLPGPARRSPLRDPGRRRGSSSGARLDEAA